MKKISFALTLLLGGLQAISQNPLMLKDVFPGNNTGTIQQIVKTTNYTFFNEDDNDADTDRSLFRTDGTTGGTIKLNLTYPGYSSTKADKLTALGNKVIFAGDNFSPGYGEIWASDGTQAGTIALERFQPTLNNRGPVFEMAAMGNYVYYGVVANNNKVQLRRTDGTPGGTSLVYEFTSFTTAPELGLLKEINGVLYFNLYDIYGPGNDMVWRSDGTAAGTYQLRDMGTEYFLMGYFMTPVNGSICFMTGKYSNNNSVLFKTDGTVAGTVPVYEFSSVYNNNLYPSFAAIGNTLYFAAHNGAGNGKELWKTDGTPGGTVMAADINPGAGNSAPLWLTVLNNNLYFSANNGTSGGELWKFDGTTASLVKDINPGAAGSGPAGLTLSGNTLLFGANNGTSGGELWITDGTAVNTLLAADINPGAGTSNPNTFTTGNPVYFAANNGVSGFEVFKYDNSDGIAGVRKIFVNDNSVTGDIFTTAVGNNANPGTKAAPVATINYALSIAQVGDTIVVDAGTYIEQVTVDKSITIKGGGASLTSVTLPAVTNPPPGTFTEKGVIQTAQNIGDVHIKDLSLTGDYSIGITPVIMQTGGSVKNCNLQSGNQGIFFRVESATKTVVAENNNIQAEYIGVNCAGLGMTASLVNNTITVNNPGFSAGVFVGADFGSVPQFTATGNIISNFSNVGIQVNSSNASITQNSIVGVNGFAINRTGGNTPVATCNWYGSASATTVASKISGTVTYSPWLINGTDISPANGFQSSPGSCPSGSNMLFVNDNSMSGNIFTTAVGNDGNPGTFNAPLATINQAINLAQAGATIYVDAGTYAENVFVNKRVTLRGAKYGQAPGASLDRGNETIIIPAIANTAITGAIIYPQADSITIDGFMLNGDNPAITGGQNVNGVDVNIGCGIYNNGTVASYLTVQNNIVKNMTTYGIGLFRALGTTTGPVVPGNLFTQNRVDNASRGIVFAYSAYGNITNNYISRCSGSGTWFSQQNVANLNNAASEVSNNIIDQCNLGMQSSSMGVNASQVNYLNNEITGTSNATSLGVSLLAANGSGFLVSNNKIQNVLTGVQVNSTNPAMSVLVNNNSISAASKAVQVVNATPVNATCNWYGTADAEAIFTKIEGATITWGPWLVNGTDNDLAARGFQPVPGACTGRQNKFYVNDNNQAGDVFTTAVGNNSNNGFSTAPFATITYAISVAQAGDTIIADAGTYAEKVTVNKSLTLRGAYTGVNPGTSLNRGASETIILPSVENNLAELFLVQAANTTIDGFLFDGDNPGITGTITLNGVDVNAGMGIQNGNLQTDNLIVKNNIFKNFYRYGVFVQKNPGSVTGVNVSRNRVDNVSSRSVRDGRGISFFANAYGRITENTMTRVHAGVFIANHQVSSADSLVISSNSIEAYNNGINLFVPGVVNSSVTVTNNTISLADLNTWNAPGSSTVNVCTGINIPIMFTSSNVLLSNNLVTGTNVGIGVSQTDAGGGLVVTNNSITQTPGYAISYINQITPMTATCNWYGSAAAQTVYSEVSGLSNFTPWLINGTDTDPAPGFQPQANTCQGQPKYYVNDNSQTGDVFTTAVGSNSNNGSSSSPFATPAYAYSVAQPGDTIYVDAGTYDLGGATYSFNKPVVFLGANYMISPNDPSNKLLPNTSRNAESKLVNGKMSIASSGISMEGFTWDVGNRNGVELVNTAATNNDFGNFRFAKNIYKITHSNVNLNSISITGKFVTSPAMPVTSGYTFADNRFEKISGATGTSLIFSYVKNITITDNSFVTGDTVTQRTQTGATLGSVGIVDSVIFSNNTIEKAVTAVGGTRIAGAVISGNKMRNTSNGFSSTNNMPESSDIEFSNNELSNDLGTPFMLYNRTGSGTSNVFKVENNIITGVSMAGVNQLFASMNFTFANTAGNPSFIIRGNKINYSGDFSSVDNQTFRPVTVRGNIKNVLLENNEVIVNNTGTLPPVNPAVLLPANPAFSIITDNSSTAYMPSNAVINVLNNKIHGLKQSVVFYDVAPAGRDAYTGYGNIPAGVTVNINNNSFTGDSISINNGTASQSVNASCNWYGSAAAQNVSQKVSVTTVNYIPWLNNGTDNDIATGFQPVPGSCNATIPTVSLDSSSNVSCFGGNNGKIYITVNGGSAPYNFNWRRNGSAGYSTVEDPTNLIEGTYDLIMTDANGSVATTTPVTITEPVILNATGSGTNVSCFGGSNGSASVNATGGIAPYTYLWNNAATSASISNLAAGNYTVTVTDANGCAANANYTVTQPTQLTATATGTSTACSNSATVVAGGGTAPYTYLWSNGATTTTIANIPAGTYTVTVTDNKGCTATASVTVTANEAFNPSASVSHVSCFGGTNGSITVTNVNSVAPFTFSIDGINFLPGTLPYSFNNLGAGTYNIAVRDANGCTGFVSKTINQPTLLTVVLNNVQSACCGQNNGAINVTASGGSGGYTYSWTGPGYTSSQRNITNLAAGNYALTVTDNNGCTANLPVTVASFNEITVSAVVTNVLCRGGATGSIDLTVSGGSNTGFTFTWTGGTASTAEDIFNLGANTYNVSIRDNGSGCIVTRSYTITQPASNLALATAKTNATGCSSLGTITATGSGGTSPYQYRLGTGALQSSGSFTNLYGGTYTVWVQDANGCTTSKDVIITDNGTDEYESNNSKNQAKSISILSPVNARIATAADAADWFKFVTPAGGGNFILSLTHPSATFTFNMYAAGNNTPALVPVSTTATSKEYVLSGNATYYISVTGGLSYVCYELMVSPPIGFAEPITKLNTPQNPVVITEAIVAEQPKLDATAYPNPHQGSFNLKITSPEMGNVKIDLFNANGQKLQEKTVSVHKSGTTVVPFNVAQHGTVFYRIQSGKYIVTGKVIGIN